MSMTTLENLTVPQKLRATLHRDVITICSECCHLLGLDITKAASEVIAELVYKKLSIYGTDLELFAKHAKRNTINSDDVKLLVRRNCTLKSHLNEMASNNQVSKEKEKRRKTTVVAVSKQAETVSAPTPQTEPCPFTSRPTPQTGPRPSTSHDSALVDNNVMDIDDTIDLTFD